MNTKWWLGLVVVAVLGIAWCARTPADALSQQIAGEGCAYAARYEWGGYRCRERDWSLWEYGDPSLEARCQVDAARCAVAKRELALVPDLIRALAEEVDEFDTGDGFIYVRAAFAQALGALGDPRAIDPLIQVLQHSGVAARTASAEALARFGPDASAAVPHLMQAARTPNPTGSMDVERLRSAAHQAAWRIRYEGGAL